MDLLLQIIVVAVAVLASTLFAAWRLTPARTRYRLLNSLRADTGGVLGRLLIGLKNKAASELTHGCGACAGSTRKPSIAGRLKKAKF